MPKFKCMLCGREEGFSRIYFKIMPYTVMCKDCYGKMRTKEREQYKDNLSKLSKIFVKKKTLTPKSRKTHMSKIILLLTILIGISILMVLIMVGFCGFTSLDYLVENIYQMGPICNSVTFIYSTAQLGIIITVLLTLPYIIYLSLRWRFGFIAYIGKRLNDALDFMKKTRKYE